MAFSISGLAQVSVGAPSLPKLWVYSTSDALATVVAADYFGTAPAALAANDLIEVKCSEGNVTLRVTAHDADAATSTVKSVGNTGVWVQASVSGLGTPGTVGWALSPVAGTIVGYRFLTTTAVDGDNILNLEVGGTNCTGSLTIASSGSAAGVVVPAAGSAYTAVTAGGAVTEGQAIKVESDGGGTTGAGVVFIRIIP